MKTRVLIGVPHYGDIPPEFTISVTQASLYLVQENKGWTCNTFFSEGSIISQQRNKIAKAAVEEGYDYLLFADSDTKFPAKDVKKLFDVDKPVVGGLYYSRRPTFRPIVFKEFDGLHYIGMKQTDLDKKPDPFPCAAVGTGFMLIKVKEVLEPMFKEDFVKEHGYPFNFWQLPNGVQMGEDLSFCYRVRELMGKEIWCEPNVFLEHMTKQYVTKDTHLAYLQRDVHYCNVIPGWMFVRELNWLFEKAMKMDSILEIGTWKGRSTHALCSGIRPGGIVHTVDHFHGSAGEEEQHWQAHAGDHDIKEIFMQNVGARFSNCILHEMPSLEFAEYCKKNGHTFDMIFLDGGHEYDEMQDDMGVHMPLAKKLFCGHDFKVFSGVTRAVEETFDYNVNVFETIWFKEME